MHAPRRAERGFSLLELLVSMAIFLIGFGVGIIPMQYFGSKGMALAGDISLASNLSSSTLEGLRVRDFATITGTESTYYDRFGLESSAPGFFKVTWEAAAQTDNVNTDVTVSTTWKYLPTDILGHQVTMTGRVFRR